MAYPLKFPVDAVVPILTVTNPKPSLWIVELHNGEDSRLTTVMIDHAIKPALDAVERHWREQWRSAQNVKGKEGAKGALVIVGKRSQDKFFSNGFDFPSVTTNSNFFPHTNNPFLARLLTFPIPTVAAINGHCFAAGMMLALACDYRVMTDGSKRNAWITMNEIHFGAPWPLSFAALLRAKVSDPTLHRKIALEGHRFTPREALEAGFVDHIVQGDTAVVLAKAEEIAESASSLAREGVWGIIKSDLYRKTLELIARDPRSVNAFVDDAAAKSRL
ncbi:hypothetical protein PILCRDRAFT_818642 [Piloderma croceum F 1598]|uniref:Enoyl-CoA hydratase n=1 Tax=Piloderma croceum (strain F 1598) TaxID=765440 RepID=A0A0C3C3V8_PILCF|nr:hypothetical protein PILCRDRAFT_818642 [Piloderma croceum F 1598]